MRIQNKKYRRGLLHARCWREIAAGDFCDNGDEFYDFITLCKINRLLECDVIYVRRQVPVFEALLHTTPSQLHSLAAIQPTEYTLFKHSKILRLICQLRG
jgi:hypothetical protein